MSENRNILADLVNSLKQERDELKLQMHLAGMEARDEYDRLCGKFDELATQFEPVSKAIDESADNVVAALKLAADEMKNGFHRIRQAIQEE